MKKLLIVFLIVSLIVPTVSFAVDPSDPIIGNWYIMFDKFASPELAPNFSENDLIFLVYSFFNDGTILQSEIDIKDKIGTPFSGAAGKWEKSGNGYSCSIIGLGSVNALIENGELLLHMPNSNFYLRFRKLVPLDAYNDYIYK